MLVLIRCQQSFRIDFVLAVFRALSKLYQLIIEYSRKIGGFVHFHGEALARAPFRFINLIRWKVLKSWSVGRHTFNAQTLDHEQNTGGLVSAPMSTVVVSEVDWLRSTCDKEDVVVWSAEYRSQCERCR